MLAAMARAMASHLPRRLSRGRARDLALGTIVDTRLDAVDDVRGSLGAFLAYHVVRLCPDETGSLENAVRRTAALTRTIKANRSHLDSLAGMKIASAVWPYLKESVRPHFMRKVLPLTAGISNVVLREDWLGGRATDRILGYSRAASTGPSVPLVLSPTTLGEAMNIGLSYRVTAFPCTKIDGIQAMLLEQLELPGRDTAARRPRNQHSNSRRSLRPTVRQKLRVAA
ncbi:MAG: hypothetical protein EOM10_17520 [Opitutae bacterium]|nr:hypothetical protein [Opitutae bacterium]